MIPSGLKANSRKAHKGLETRVTVSKTCHLDEDQWERLRPILHEQNKSFTRFMTDSIEQYILNYNKTKEQKCDK